MTSRPRAAGLVLGAGAAWVVIEDVAGPALSGYSPYQVVWSRYALHLLVVMLWAGRSAPWRTRRPVLQLLASLCMLAMPYCFVIGARRMPMGNVWAFFWVSPLLALAIAGIALREKPARLTWLVAGISFACALLVFAEKPIPPIVDLLAPIATALSFAVYIVLLRLLREESLASKLFYTAAGVFVALTPAMGYVFVPPDPRAVAAMVAIALFGLALLALLDRALETAPVATVAPFVYGVPLGHVVITTALGAGPGRRAATAAVVLAAVLVVAFRREARISSSRPG